MRVAVLALLSVAAWTQATFYKGTIGGKYAIEMELQNRNDKSFTGRYSYAGKAQWLTLRGTLTGAAQSHLDLKEFAPNGQNTGGFSLDHDGEQLKGHWHRPNGEGKLPVVLQLSEAPAAAGLSGTYRMRVEVDMSRAPKDHRDEVPMGTLKIKETTAGELGFDLDFNSGYPQYHIAQVEGVAKRNGQGKWFFSKRLNLDVVESCVVHIHALGKDLDLFAPNGPACGFGPTPSPRERTRSSK